MTESSGHAVSVVIPTRDRPGYLEVTLGSIVEQCGTLNAEIIVVDDGASELTKEICNRFGVKYLANPRPSGANVARNLGLESATGQLLILLDDDIRADANWLAAYLKAADKNPEFGIFGGPIRPVLEGSSLRICGREPLMISSLLLGPETKETELVWSANMMFRRSVLESVGPFDQSLAGSGEEEEWIRRYTSDGGRVLYVTDAGVDHRRTGSDAKLKSLSLSAYGRGRDSLRYDQDKGVANSLPSELRTLLGCVSHILRYRCLNGVIMSSHSAGRLRELLLPSKRDPATVGVKRGSGN